jgi:hypothetical protein
MAKLFRRLNFKLISYIYFQSNFKIIKNYF